MLLLLKFQVSNFNYTKSITHPCDFHVIEIVQMAPNRVKRHKKCGEGCFFLALRFQPIFYMNH